MFPTETATGVCAQPPVQTKGFVFNHTMLRVRDPAVALDFYTRVMGMRLLRRVDFPEMTFSLYFLACIGDPAEIPADPGQRMAYTFAQSGVLELTHNWGTEDQAAFSYHSGNEEPKGFGHICFSVPDLNSAVQWFDENGLTYVKRPDAGKIKNVAFVKDPDGYWIEILQPDLLKQLGQGVSAS